MDHGIAAQQRVVRTRGAGGLGQARGDQRGQVHHQRKAEDRERKVEVQPQQVERQMRANLTGTASLGAFYRDYVGIDGHDVGWDAELGLTYWLNRYFGITGRGRHEQLVSNLPDRDYKAESVFLGVEVQR